MALVKEAKKYNYDNSMIYYDAFNDYYRNIWRGIKDIGLNEDEIINICYNRALSCFWYESEIDFQDRQIVLYNYMVKDYEGNDENSLLNLHSSILPADSDIKEIISDFCTAYDEPPTRTFSKNQGTNLKFKDLYDEAMVDTLFGDVYELAQICGVIAVAPVLIDGKMKVIIKTPDTFRVWTDPNNLWKVVKMVYPDISSVTGQIIFHEWTDDTYRILDKNGEQINEEVGIFSDTIGENKYGKIPFVFLRLKHHLEFLSGGRADFLYQQLLWNKVKTAAENVATYCGFPIGVATNINQDRIGVNKLIGMKQGVTNEDALPSLEFVTPEQIYSDLMEFRTNLINQFKTNLGIPLEESAQATGLSRILARQKLIEKRLKDLDRLKNFEMEFAELVKILVDKENLFATDLGDLEFGIDFAEERIYNDPTLERQDDWSKVKEGLIDVLDYFKKWSGSDIAMSENKVFKLLEERIKRLDEYNSYLKTKKEEPIEEQPTNPEEMPQEIDTQIEEQTNNIEEENGE